MFFSFIVPLIYFILANGLVVVISKRTFGKCMPITMMITAFTYFFSQVLCHTFKVGLIINVLYAIIFLIILIILKSKHKNQVLDNIKKRFFSKGFYAFLVIFIIIYIFDFNRTFSYWDEYSHWGEMIKEMLRIDNFYTVPKSTLLWHKDYPPIMQLFEMFYTTLSGGYKEAYLQRAMHLFNFTLFISFIYENDQKFNKIKISLKSLFMMIIIFLVFLLFDQHGIINTIYQDYVMVIMAAYLLSIIMTEKDTLSKFSVFSLTIGLSFLLLTKQMGLALYFMVIFMLIIDLLLKYRFKLNNIFKKKNLLLLIIIIVPLIFLKGWDIYVESFHINKQFKLSDIRITELKGIIDGTSGEIYQQEAADNYIQAIKTTGLTTTKISLTYFQCVLLSIFLLYFVWIYGKNIFTKKQIILFGVTLVMGSIGYAFTMLNLYVFNFGSYEGPILSSFNRYMPSYILLLLSAIMMIYIYIDNKKENPIRYYLLLILLLLLIEDKNILYKCKPAIKKPNYERQYINIIKNNTPENAKIFVLSQNQNENLNDNTLQIKYYINPRLTNLDYSIWNIGETDTVQEYFEKNIENYMLEFDYFYILSLGNINIEDCQFLFDDNSHAQNNQLYKIINNNGKIKLKIVH